MAIKVLVGRTGAKTSHADEGSVRTDNGIPALANAGFDRDVDLGAAGDGLALGFRQSKQQLKARHRNDPGANVARGKKLASLDRERDLRARCEQRYVGSPAVRREELIGARRTAIARIKAAAQLRDRLSTQPQHARPNL